MTDTKAIILEVRDGYAAALREDGLVVKTRQIAAVGETVELSEKAVQFPSQGKRIMRTAVAAALILAVTGGTYTYTNVAAASYVTLDTEETSVELSVNRMGRVIGVRALDEDSSELADALAADVRRMTVEDAVDVAMKRMDGASTVVAGVTGDTEKRTADLQEAVERGASRAALADAEFVTLEISRDERREAGERDMSAGRWAFERGGGRWRDEDDDPDDILDNDDRPAFLPGNGGAAANQGFGSMTPPDSSNTSVPSPSNGDMSGNQPPRMDHDDDRDDDGNWDDDRDNLDGRDDDDVRPAPPEQSGGQPEPGGDRTPPESGEPQTPEDSGIQQREGDLSGEQPPPYAPETGQAPPEGAFGFVPQGDVQPPQTDMRSPQGGIIDRPGGMPGDAPQR